MINRTLIMEQRDRCTVFSGTDDKVCFVFSLPSCFFFFCQKWSETTVGHLFACLATTDLLILGQNWLPDMGHAPYVVISCFFFLLSLQNLTACYWVIGWPGGHHPWENAAVKPFFSLFFSPAGRCGRACSTPSNEAAMCEQRERFGDNS